MGGYWEVWGRALIDSYERDEPIDAGWFRMHEAQDAQLEAEAPCEPWSRWNQDVFDRDEFSKRYYADLTARSLRRVVSVEVDEVRIASNQEDDERTWG